MRIKGSGSAWVASGDTSHAARRGQWGHCPLAFEPLIRITCS